MALWCCSFGANRQLMMVERGVYILIVVNRQLYFPASGSGNSTRPKLKRISVLYIFTRTKEEKAKFYLGNSVTNSLTLHARSRPTCTASLVGTRGSGLYKTFFFVCSLV